LQNAAHHAARTYRPSLHRQCGAGGPLSAHADAEERAKQKQIGKSRREAGGEIGQLVLELSDYCVQDIAQTVRSTLEPLAADKKLAFKLELAPGLPPGHGDGRRLAQVLINLVGNAIKFTDAGEVAIKAEVHNGSFHVSVRDTGPGISSADQARLFQEFQQADNAITRKKGGTGLGARHIEAHH
jgi:signal transduction histidine kinase